MKARAAMALTALLLAAAAPAHAEKDFFPAGDLDALFTYGIGNGSALGGMLHATASWRLWRTDLALGTVELGALGGYQNEPIALQPWMAESETTGATHRIPFALTLGHSFRFGAADEISLGTHVYGGGVHWISSYHVVYARRGVEGDGVTSATVPDLGAFLRFTYRPHPVVGLSVQAGAPFPGISPDTVVGLFTMGVGMTFRIQ